MNRETKSALEIIISEIQDLLNGDNCVSSLPLKLNIEELLKGWITTNNLHPENVQTFHITDNTANSKSHTINITLPKA